MDSIIILCQETLCYHMKAIRVFLGFKPRWCVAAVDANGHSGGTISIWDLTMVNLNAYIFFGGILLSG